MRPAASSSRGATHALGSLSAPRLADRDDDVTPSVVAIFTKDDFRLGFRIERDHAPGPVRVPRDRGQLVESANQAKLRFDAKDGKKVTANDNIALNACPAYPLEHKSLRSQPACIPRMVRTFGGGELFVMEPFAGAFTLPVLVLCREGIKQSFELVL